MNQALEIQELAIVITAKNYDPSLLNPGFLKYSGIVSSDWELAKKPVINNRGAQIIFNNGVYIAAQPNRLMFVEALNSKEDVKAAEIPQLAHRYIEILRTIEYQAVGINFRGYATCSNTTVEENNYLIDNFIQPGEWQNCGTKPVKAGLNLAFDYGEKQLSLSINEAGLKLPDSEQAPIVLFSGNFNYDLSSEELSQVLPKLNSVITNWQQDLEIYAEVVDKLQRNKSLKSSRKKETVAVQIDYRTHRTYAVHLNCIWLRLKVTYDHENFYI